MNWDIKKCEGKCMKCNKLLEDREEYYCRLFLEQSGPVREDYCKDCWGKRDDTAKGYSTWTGRYKPEPVEIEDNLIEEPYLKHLLKKWLHSTERLHQCFCYVLAILLERSKIFSEKPAVKTPEGKEQLVYEDKETGETYILDNPHLSIRELGEIETQLQELIKQELPGAGK